jgi:mRNA interferase MazF
MGGHLEGEARPVLVVSDDAVNQGPLQKVIVVPLSTRNRGYPTHVPLPPQRPRSFIYCEDVRSISILRLKNRAYPAPVPNVVMEQVQDRLRLLMRL